MAKELFVASLNTSSLEEEIATVFLLQPLFCSGGFFASEKGINNDVRDVMTHEGTLELNDIDEAEAHTDIKSQEDQAFHHLILHLTLSFKMCFCSSKLNALKSQ